MNEIDKEAQMLDLINRVQMFQIASSRVNQNLLMRKKQPVFNLQFTEAFDQRDNNSQGEEIDKLSQQLAEITKENQSDEMNSSV